MRLPPPPLLPPQPRCQVCDALNRRRTRRPGGRLRNPPGSYVTGLLVPRGGAIRVDPAALALLGVRHVLEVDSYLDDMGRANFEPGALVAKVDEMLRLHWEAAAAAAAGAGDEAAGAGVADVSPVAGAAVGGGQGLVGAGLRGGSSGGSPDVWTGAESGAQAGSGLQSGEGSGAGAGLAGPAGSLVRSGLQAAQQQHTATVTTAAMGRRGVSACVVGRQRGASLGGGGGFTSPGDFQSPSVVARRYT